MSQGVRWKTFSGFIGQRRKRSGGLHPECGGQCEECGGAGERRSGARTGYFTGSQQLWPRGGWIWNVSGRWMGRTDLEPTMPHLTPDRSAAGRDKGRRSQSVSLLWWLSNVICSGEGRTKTCRNSMIFLASTLRGARTAKDSRRTQDPNGRCLNKRRRVLL